VARRLGSLRVRAALAAVAFLIVAIGIYWLFIRQDTAEPKVAVPHLAARIGEGSAAVAVAANGHLVRWLPLPEEPALPRLPLESPPKGGRVKGPALEQVRVLAAAPNALRPYVESSSYGDSGVDVALTTGIEVRFGDASQAARKWRAAAAVLADPEVSGLDYVNVQAPSRPSWSGSEHELPPPP
jgi:cell division septal protein FtsQ